MFNDICDFFIRKDCDLKFGWLGRNTLGCILLDQPLMLINLALLITRVFIHEYLHWKYPGQTERAIRIKTERVMKKLTNDQIRQIARLYVLHAEKGDSQDGQKINDMWPL